MLLVPVKMLYCMTFEVPCKIIWFWQGEIPPRLVVVLSLVVNFCFQNCGCNGCFLKSMTLPYDGRNKLK